MLSYHLSIPLFYRFEASCTYFKFVIFCTFRVFGTDMFGMFGMFWYVWYVLVCLVCLVCMVCWAWIGLTQQFTVSVLCFQVEDMRIGSVPVRLYTPVSYKKPGRGVIFYHGGGFTISSIGMF